MLGTRAMSEVLSSRLVDVLLPKQPDASTSSPPPFAIERGFAEVREYGQLELRAGVACRSLLRCISNHLHGTDTMQGVRSTVGVAASDGAH